MSDKATRTEITIGSYSIEGFMLPDGSYTLSQTQAAEVVGEPEINARRFLTSRGIKALLGEDYTPDTFEIQSSPEQGRGASRIRGLPLEIVSAYWLWQSYKGNKQALALCMALMTETLERRFDTAFGISRSEEERDQRLSDRLSSRDLEAIGMLLAEDDDLRRENAELRQQLTELGADPYELPGDDG